MWRWQWKRKKVHVKMETEASYGGATLSVLKRMYRPAVLTLQLNYITQYVQTDFLYICGK